MKNSIITYCFQFAILVLLQVLVANRILLWDFITPFISLFFIVSLPVSLDKWIQILACFLFGLCIDFFENSGGANAAACLVAIYAKPMFIRLFYQGEENLRDLYLTKDKPLQLFGILLSIIVCHHLVVFSFEFYDFSFWNSILKYTFWNSIFTFVVLVLCIAIFRNKPRYIQ